MSELNSKQMVGEIASRHGIRLDEADPAFVVVRLSQLALEEACQVLVGRVSINLREFEAAVEKVQARAGRYVAAEFNEGAAALCRELQDDIVRAGVREVELVEKLIAPTPRPCSVVGSASACCQQSVFSPPAHE